MSVRVDEARENYAATDVDFFRATGFRSGFELRTGAGAGNMAIADQQRASLDNA